MATVSYYFNGYSTGSWNDSAYGCDVNLSTFAYILTADLIKTLSLNTNQCAGTSLGLITDVTIFTYAYCANVSLNTYIKIRPKFGGSSFGDLHTVFQLPPGSSYAAQWSAHSITNDTNHPTWGVDWSAISNLDLDITGFKSDSFTTVRSYDTYIDVTYTPHVDSTLSWSTPSEGGYSYRNQSLALSGTAANSVAGVSAVQYNIDGAAWVTCTGTTSWSATIANTTLNALAHGSHTLYTQVQRNGDDAWTSTTSRTFVISPLPAQTI
jgi:hypothetical protein